VPTLILVGDQDSPQVRATAAILAGSIGGAETIVVRGAGHLLNIDAPQQFNKAVLDFLVKSC
jgi:pimeloyl-ACP methyl ester carboxylesterase